MPCALQEDRVTLMRLKHERVSAMQLIPARHFSQPSAAVRSAKTNPVKSVAVKKLLCQSLAVIALASGEGARAADSLPAWNPKALAPAWAAPKVGSGFDW